MNPLTEARAEVAAVINALGITGLHVFPYVPGTDKVTAPAAVVFPDDNYLSAGQTFAEWDVSLKVRLLLGKGTNEVLTQTLDGLIVEVANALQKKFGGVSVSSPAIDRESFDSPFFTVDITIANITIEKEA